MICVGLAAVQEGDDQLTCLPAIANDLVFRG